MYGADDSPYTVLRSWLYRRPILTVFLFFVIAILLGSFFLWVFDQPMGRVFPEKKSRLGYMDEVWQAATVMLTGNFSLGSGIR